MTFKIYEIVPTCDSDDSDRYIGSTCLTYISQRYALHTCAYRKYTNEQKGGFISSFKLFDKYGLDKCRIRLIEELDDDALAGEEKRRERYWIETLPNCNLRNPHRTHDEKKEYHRSYSQRFYETDSGKQAKRDYYQNVIKPRRAAQNNLSDNTNVD
jgi:hypothetical protein